MSIPQFEAPQIEDLQDLLPAYEIIDFIAKGGMGAVYRARQLSLDREVAIKILPREFGENEEFRKSFGAEARAMAKLNHPNLIGVYDCGEVEGMPYIVMEYLDGESLAERLSRERPLKILDTFKIIEQSLLALAAAHERGIIHRDFKAENVFLVRKPNHKGDFDARLLDFGVAKIVHEDHTQYIETRPGFLVGTPYSMAPEQIQGGAIDHVGRQVEARLLQIRGDGGGHLHEYPNYPQPV